jgi:hypothetical protein
VIVKDQGFHPYPYVQSLNHLTYIGAMLKEIAIRLGVRDLPNEPPVNTADWIKELAYLTPQEIQQMEEQEINEAKLFFGAMLNE